ncbi:alpha/beta fold hydrolase [Streptomyces sp. NPDC004752]
MPIVVADDGYKLWYEVVGDGPALVFPARSRGEFGSLAAALAGQYRVVRYMPRRVVGLTEPEEDVAVDPEDQAGGPWDAASWTSYPIDREVADLHTVADAAGVGDFVLAGYSGMAALAGFLVPFAERAKGLMLGGFPLLASNAYWLGCVEGARSAFLLVGEKAKADGHHVDRLLYREWDERDDRPALAALPGPKILWYGTRDCEPECRMHDYVGGAAIARRIAEHAGELRALGFQIIELDGQDHIGALAETDLIAPQLAAALGKSGW